MQPEKKKRKVGVIKRKAKVEGEIKMMLYIKDRPITRFWEVLDTQCVQFRYQESKLYPMVQKYEGDAKNI